MTMARRLNTVACLTVLAAVMSYCVADAKPILAALAVMAISVGWWAGSTTPPRALPRLLVNLLVVVAILHAATATMRPAASVVSNLAEFLVYIQLIKLFDRRTPRDDGHALTLSVFIVIGSILTSNTLGVGLLVLLYTPLAISAAMLLQLHGGQTAAVGSRPPAEREAMRTQPPPPSVGRGYRRDFRLSASGAVVASVLLAAMAFLFTPRGMGENLLGGFGRVGKHSVGFTDQIRLGQSGLLNPGDHAPVMEMQLFDGDDEPLGDRLGPIHLRATARDEYRDGAWMTSSYASNLPQGRPALGPRRPRAGTFPREDTDLIMTGEGQPPGAVSSVQPSIALNLVDSVPRGAALIKQRIALRQVTSLNYLFAAWHPVRLGFEEPTPVSIGQHLALQRLGGSRGPFTYTVVSARGFVDPGQEPRPDVHFDSERIRELAVRLLTERRLSPDPLERDPASNQVAASLFQSYLRQNCTYTLKMIAPERGEDPIEMFLFRTRRGHCEYFASAMVAMCQSVGLDARVVMGYLASEYNSIAGVYVVRQSNAHAWAEVNVAPGRWATVDPSPPDDLSRYHRTSRGVLGRLKQFYDALEFTWVNAVVTFDESKRSGLVGGMDSWPVLDDVRKFLGGARELASRFRPGYVLAPVWLFPGILVVACAVLLEVRILRKRLQARAARIRQSSRQVDAALGRMLEQASFYADALRGLDQAGLAKPESTPPLRHASELSAHRPDLGATLAALTGLYYVVRFGHTPLSPQQLESAHGALARLRSLLTAPAPRARPT